MSDDCLTINTATVCLVREILINERDCGVDVSLSEAAEAIRMALPFLTKKKRRGTGGLK